MNDVGDERRAALRALFEQHKTNAAKVAKDGNFSPNTLYGFLRGDNQSLTQTTIDKIAAALGIDPSEVFANRKPGARSEPAHPPSPQPNVEFRPNPDPPHDPNGPRRKADLPVYSSAQGGPDGMVIRYEAIDWIDRPAALSGMKDAFAFYVVGDSMSPRYDEGERVLVEAPRPGRPGDDLLIILANGDDEVEFAAMVKRLVRQNSQEMVVQQFNPPKEFAIERTRIKQVFPIRGRL